MHTSLIFPATYVHSYYYMDYVHEFVYSMACSITVLDWLGHCSPCICLKLILYVPVGVATRGKTLAQVWHSLTLEETEQMNKHVSQDLVYDKEVKVGKKHSDSRCLYRLNV